MADSIETLIHEHHNKPSIEKKWGGELNAALKKSSDVVGIAAEVRTQMIKLAHDGKWT